MPQSDVRTPLLLVRHGQTPWNAAGRWQGHGDPGLSPEGRQQALALARTISAGEDAVWTGVIASDLQRARETAEAIASALGLSVGTDPRLRELDVGAWSGLTRPEIEARDPQALREFESGEPSVRPGGGESRIEIRERALAFVRDLARDRSGERLIVVTHLGVIRALVPGAEPTNAARIRVHAEDLASRTVDRVRRREDGAL